MKVGSKRRLGLKAVLFGVATVATLVGVGLLAQAGSYFYSYLMDQQSPVRHEYLGGVMMSVILSFPFWLAASGAIFPLCKDLPRLAFVVWNLPAVGIVVLFVALLLQTAASIMWAAVSA